MRVRPLDIPDLLLVQPDVYRDERGLFVETFAAARYDAAGIPTRFVQDNLSRSRRHVLRGLHFQEPGGQGKLVSVARGEVFDVAVDVRVGSPTFGRWAGTRLTADGGEQLWIPEGFAHGFVVLSDEAVFAYKCTAYYDRTAEWSLRWDDPDVGIDWPVAAPVLSDKDRAAPRLRELPHHRLPRWRPPAPGRDGPLARATDHGTEHVTTRARDAGVPGPAAP